LKKLIYIMMFFCFSLLMLATKDVQAQLKGNIKIAVFQVKTSPELYATSLEGFFECLSEAGFKEGRNLTVDRYEAHGDMELVEKMLHDITTRPYDLIVSMGTQSTQLLQQNRVTKTPVIFCPVIDPVESGLVKNIYGSRSNYAGASHNQSMYSQISVLLELIPSVKKIGVLIRVGNNSPTLQIKELEKAKSVLGITDVIVSKASDINDIKRATSDLIGKVDAIYLPADILVSGSASKAIVDIALENNVPVMAAVAEPVRYGALVSVYTDLVKLGYLAGQMALQVINGKDPGLLPIAYQQTPNVILNRDAARRLNISIPSSFTAKVTGVISKNVEFQRER
jgi:putative ABC transport system substrate-binding protein